MGGLEYLLKPCARLDTRLHPVLDPGVVSSLEYECSVTQSTPGDYCYFSGGTVGRFCEPIRAKAKGRKWKHSSGAKRRYSCVFTFTCNFGSPTRPSYGFWRSGLLTSEGNQKYRLCLDQTCYSLVTQYHGRLSNRC